MKNEDLGIHRREFIGGVTALAASQAIGVSAAPRQGAFRGYPDKQSYVPGEKLRLHTSVGVEQFNLAIERVGRSRERVWMKHGIKGGEHSVPKNASSHGCNWPVSVEVRIPVDWRSGYYEARLSASTGGKNFSTTIPFVLRSAHPGRNSKILLQLATNTDNAYNNWGGHSLYAYNSARKEQGRRVSSHRPMPWSPYKRWEAHFVHWAESNGYAIDYAVNNDLEFHADMLSKYRLVLSIGHDEYWSTPMRDALEGFVAGGGNAAFFSGNTCCWQVRAEDDGNALVCYKEFYKDDPLYRQDGLNPLLSTLWSHHLLDRPENEMTGVGALHGGYHRAKGQYMGGSGAFKVHRPDHWIFAETDTEAGAELGGAHTVVGYECDGCHFEMKGGLPVPTGVDRTPKNFQILATAPAKWGPEDTLRWYERWPEKQQGAACLGLYTKPGGGTVFTAGTTDWSHGLKGKPDPVVDRVTRNVLDRLSTPL